MILKDIFSQFSFDDIFADLSYMMPVLNQKRNEIKEAWDFLMSQQPIASKKKIKYQLIDAQDSDDCFVGAEDRCFEAQWNVILGKEIIVDDDIAISNKEIATNCFFCILLIGFNPRRFAELREQLTLMME